MTPGKQMSFFDAGRWSKVRYKANPDIYEWFVDFALRATKVRDYFSAKIIFHRMRWETDIEENNSDLKIDDGWISHYARKFMDEFPEHKGFFKTRKGVYHD